jgi:hypothetical protein
VALPDSPGFELFSPEVIECLYDGCISYILTLLFRSLLSLEKVSVFFLFYTIFYFHFYF